MDSRSGLAVLALLLSVTLPACDRETSESLNPDRPKWQIDYSGDLSGHIEGKSLVIVRTGPSEHLNFAVRTIGNISIRARRPSTRCSTDR